MEKETDTQKEKEYVWEFTNQKKLTKKEFIQYFEKKVFKTIRKYNLLPKNKIITLKKSDLINSKILKHILTKKFKVEYNNKPNITCEDATEISEKAFQNILNGKFEGQDKEKKITSPLYHISEKEIDTYSKILNIEGKKRKRDKKISELLEKFSNKNQDMELNIIKALGQIPK